MKTKQIILFLLGLCWISLQFAQAQTNTVYQFQNRSNGKYLSVADDESSITLAEKTSKNRLNQYFIIKEISNGNLLIASCQNPRLFLKKDGTFSEIAGATTDYEWSIDLGASNSGPANAQVYGVIVSESLASNPVLGMNADGTKAFQAYPSDIFNDGAEKICFAIISRNNLF